MKHDVKDFIEWLPEDLVSAAVEAFDGAGDKAWSWESSMRDFKSELFKAATEYQKQNKRADDKAEPPTTGIPAGGLRELIAMLQGASEALRIMERGRK